MEKDTQVLGVSCDSRATLAAYILSLGPSDSYPIRLLSDFHPHGEMTKSYGLYNEEKGTAFRSIVIVDKEGIIRFRRVYASAADIHMNDMLAEVDKL